MQHTAVFFSQSNYNFIPCSMYARFASTIVIVNISSHFDSNTNVCSIKTFYIWRPTATVTFDRKMYFITIMNVTVDRKQEEKQK